MKKSLLIVDDNPDITSLISDYIADMFDEVITASSVDEAQDKILVHNFSLITLDINLHGRNGSEVIKYIMDTPENGNKKTPIILISGMMTNEFIEKNKPRFAGVLTKPFDMSILRTLAEDVLRGNKTAQNPIELQDLNNVPQIKCQMPFTVYELDQKVEQELDKIRKDAKLKKLFSSMKINRDPNSYHAVHVGMLINISTAISMKLEWNTDKTLGKFIYASYLHDIALAERDDLARISSLEELNDKKKTLSLADYKLVFEHPNIAASTIEDYKEIPIDVLTIIRQHHEMPNETGFPSKISQKKIGPMSAIFILSHDLTNYIMSNPNWNIAEYLVVAKAKFTGSHFNKAINALASLA